MMTDTEMGQLFFEQAYEKGNECVRKMLAHLKNQEKLQERYCITDFASTGAKAEDIQGGAMWLLDKGIFTMAFVDEKGGDLDTGYVADVIRPFLKEKKPLPKEAENFYVNFKPTTYLRAWHEHRT